jgi:hypothetical protein
MHKSIVTRKVPSFDTNQGDEETSSEEKEFHQVDNNINADHAEMDTETLVSENQSRPGRSKSNKRPAQKMLKSIVTRKVPKKRTSKHPIGNHRILTTGHKKLRVTQQSKTTSNK